MLLRKIGLHGFKSFAERLEVCFEPGITGVVGPNGSGKSNISDAVKWVLGESSAKELRGSRMEDVIFNGSSGRRALGLAEVTLTLDNSDGFLPVGYSEVSVTRRLYRSGDSEFLLNRTPCRLKDIQELFLDSGVGRHAYALLSQAEVEAVLSAHPEERRRLFDEAAGVAKFRAKKAEALRRLGETEQNLTRVGDILGELSTQLGPLAEKARRAERHAVLSTELREVEVGVLAGALQEAQFKVEAAGEELTRREMAASSAASAVQLADARVAELRLALAQVDGAREEAAREVLRVATELERVEGEWKMAQERQERWNAEREQLAAAQAELAGRREVAAAAVEEAGEAGKVHLERLAEAHRVVEERSARLSEATLTLRQGEEELERKKGELIEAMNEAAQLRNDLRGLEASREVAESHRERVRVAEAESVAAVEVAREAVAAAALARQGAQSELEASVGRLKAMQSEAAAVGSEGRRLAEEVRRAEGELSRLRSRQQVLSDWQRQREGYGEGPRAIMAERAAGRLGGVIGTVAELVRVPAEVELAIETALGGSLQDVVVEDEEVARRGIRFLKERSAGRVTFLPLALLSPRPLPARERRELSEAGGAGFLGVGDELVGFEPEMRPAVEYLLGRVLVTRDLETALKVGRAAGLRYLVVTTEGDVVRPGGAVTGGREERGRGLLRRQRELTELTETVKAAEQERARLASALEDSEARAASGRAAEAQREAERQAAAATVASAEREEAVRASELRQAEAAVARVRADLAGLSAGLSQEREEDLKGRLALREEARLELEREIAAGTAAARELAAKREAAAEELTAARVGSAEVEKDAEVALAASDRARTEAEALVREGAASAERATDLERKMAEAAALGERFGGERAALGERRAAAEDRSAQLGLERTKLSEDLAEAESAADTVRLRQDEARQSAQEADLEAARAELEAESLAARLEADWGIPRAEALNLPAITGAEREGAATRAEAVRRRLKALGAVDPDSIGEYTALSERHAFLSQQYDDLTTARQSLTDVLAEIETATTRRFTTTFAAVQEEFQQLFKQVFGGGRAQLRLTDPENPAESGIEVEVQPPGKKNQNLLALSSGERTMTALSLLFAMMRVRPAPFCVLDEVDAALDEANLGRFVGLLKGFAGGMQFIVITHRRPTMEAAGVLYGVTMEEPGISQLVSVRLNEAG